MKKFSFFFLIVFLISSCTTNNNIKKSKPIKIEQKPVLKSNTNDKKIKELEAKIASLEQKIKLLTKRREREQLTEKQNKLLLERIRILSMEQQKNIEYLKKISFELAKIKNKQSKEKLSNGKRKISKPKQKKTNLSKKTDKKQVNSENRLYLSCYKIYLKKQYSESEKCFNRFIARFPKSKLLSNAYFWIGETYYSRGNFPKAIDYYDIILTKFSSSSKVPAALLKEGLAFYQLKDNEGAKIFLQKVIHDFPKTKQAEYAKKYLEKYQLK